jgi:heme-degrading monooxygenase HmoA
MHGRIATYTYTGDAHDIARKAEEGILPVFETQPGFKTYSIVATDEKIISISAWETAEAAEAANAQVADWVAQNLADEVELQKTQIGEIIVSTTLGISTKARVTA